MQGEGIVVGVIDDQVAALLKGGFWLAIVAGAVTALLEWPARWLAVLGITQVVIFQGFPVLLQLRRELRRPLHWSMNTNLVLAMTALLLVLGTVIIALFEWSNPATIGDMSVGDRVLVSFFHSVQARTAGRHGVRRPERHHRDSLQE